MTCQWLGLRALLQAEPDLCVLADIQQASEVVRVATAQHPDHVLVDAAVGGFGLIPLARQVRRASPTSRVVVVGTKDMLRRDTLLQLLEQGTCGYLLWERLDGGAVVRCLAAVRDDDLLVGHRLVLEELLDMPERRHRPRHDEPALTGDARAVLSLLVGDLTQQEIAATLHLSEATVKRTVTALRATFGVRTTNALCWQAGRLGFVPHAAVGEATAREDTSFDRNGSDRRPNFRPRLHRLAAPLTRRSPWVSTTATPKASATTPLATSFPTPLLLL